MNDIINIDVLGEKFSFQIEKDDNDAREAAEFFLNELEEIQSKLSEESCNVSKLVKLLLATMNIADKYLEVKSEYERIKKDLDYHINNLNLKMS